MNIWTILALLWVLSALASFVWCAARVYAGLHGQLPLPALTRAARSRLLLSATLTIALLGGWRSWRIYLLGPIGLWSLFLARGGR